jgi:hypothetical protein
VEIVIKDGVVEQSRAQLREEIAFSTVVMRVMLEKLKSKEIKTSKIAVLSKQTINIKCKMQMKYQK